MATPYVELVHFITALADTERSDFAILLESAGVERAQFDGELVRAIDALPHGAGAVEEFSDHIFRAIQEAWSYGALEFGEDQVRSAYILLGCLQVPVLEGLLYKMSLEFDKIDPKSMAAQLDDLLVQSLERTFDETDSPQAKKKRPVGNRHWRNTPQT